MAIPPAHSSGDVSPSSLPSTQGQLGYLDLKRLFESAIKVDDTWDKGYFEYARSVHAP